MKIRLIDFGLTPGHNPLRVHENDAGADVADCQPKRPPVPYSAATL